MNHFNQLSELLYLGNVVGNFRPLLGIIGLILMGLTALLIVLLVSRLCDPFRKHEYSWILFSMSLVLFVLASACWVGAAFCPSQQTVYAIAASEMGEKALETPVMNKTLEAWLDKQIEQIEQKEQK